MTKYKLLKFCYNEVIASEDWQGTRPDYRVTSDEASFRVDYTPKVGYFDY